MKNLLVTPIKTHENQMQLKISEMPALTESKKVKFFKAWITHPIFDSKELAWVDKMICLQMSVAASFHLKETFEASISAYAEVQKTISDPTVKRRYREFTNLANDVSRGCVVLLEYIHLIRATYCTLEPTAAHADLDGLDDYCQKVFVLVTSSILECDIDLIEQQGVFFKSYMESLSDDQNA